MNWHKILVFFANSDQIHRKNVISSVNFSDIFNLEVRLYFHDECIKFINNYYGAF